MGNNVAGSMNWGGYEIYHPGVLGPLHTLPRTEARRAFNQLMDARPGRIQMLHWLLKANGTELAGTDAGIQDLSDWFLASVEADSASAFSWQIRSRVTHDMSTRSCRNVAVNLSPRGRFMVVRIVSALGY